MEIDLLLLIAAFPVFTLDGITRIGQNIVALGQRVLMFSVVSTLVSFILRLFTTPLYLAGIVAAINFAPNTIRWIFAKMGALAIDFALQMVEIMQPVVADVAKGEAFEGLSNTYVVAYTNLPPEINEMLASLGVHEMLGLIITFWVTIMTLLIIFMVTDRAYTNAIATVKL